MDVDDDQNGTVRDGLMAFAVVIVVSGLASGILLEATGGYDTASESESLLAGVAGTAIGMISGLVYGRKKASADVFSLRPCTPEWAVYAVALVVPVLGLGYGWATLLEWLGTETQPQTYVHAILTASDPMTLVLSVAYGIVGAAVFEELLFRGIIQPPMVARWGVWMGIAAQGCLFGLMHMVDPWAILPTAVIGCVAGWLRHKTGALGAPILFHAVNNCLALFFNATMH